MEYNNPNYHKQVGVKLDRWHAIIFDRAYDVEFLQWCRVTAEKSDKLPPYALAIVDTFISERTEMWNKSPNVGL